MLELEQAWEALAAKVMSLANRNADLEWVRKPVCLHFDIAYISAFQIMEHVALGGISVLCCTEYVLILDPDVS